MMCSSPLFVHFLVPGTQETRVLRRETCITELALMLKTLLLPHVPGIWRVELRMVVLPASHMELFERDQHAFAFYFRQVGDYQRTPNKKRRGGGGRRRKKKHEGGEGGGSRERESEREKNMM